MPFSLAILTSRYFVPQRKTLSCRPKYNRLLNRYLFSFLFLLVCATHFAAAQTPVVGEKQTAFINYLSFLEEGDSPKSIDEIKKGWQDGKAQRLSSASVNFGRSSHRHWISFTAESNAAQDFVLELSNPFLYRIELYDETGKLLYQTGIDLPFDSRPVYHRRFAFPLSLHSGQNQFYLMVDRRGELLRFTMDFYSKEDFALHRINEALFFGSVFGILLFIAVFSLALRVVLRDKIHTWYFAYILLMGLFVAADNGFGYQWFWPHLPWLQKYVRNFLSVGAFAVQLRFMQYFLQQTAANSRLFIWVRRTVGAAVFLLIVLAGYSVMDSEGINLTGWPTILAQAFFYATFLAGISLLIWSTLQMIQRRKRSAAIYLLAMLPLVLQMLVVMASRWHLLHADIDTPKFFAVAVLLEVITLGCGLLLRYYALKKEKEDLATTLHLQEQTHLQNIVAAQDGERKRIAEDLHDHLGGTLSAVKGMLSSAPASAHTTQAESVLEEACNDLRFIAHSLMPAAFAQQSLATAINELVQKAALHRKTTFLFFTHGNPLALSKQTELTVFRMASELVQNVLKHSAARNATVQLLYFDDGLQLMVEDDGCGFDLSAKRSGIGLKNLYSRAKYINATLSYDTGPEGTTAICTVPIEPNA